ncbi:hypothetical protein SASPL_142871 [Salvia splendens]|uniref:Uncharacterized protein n=1 Tax=Salvia splendens TaxID=180675 RepID=A0A8X8WKX9_SALSN|nr:hypothetical protein SASPL_142871 [Salvia splendens]
MTKDEDFKLFKIQSQKATQNPTIKEDTTKKGQNPKLHLDSLKNNNQNFTFLSESDDCFNEAATEDEMQLLTAVLNAEANKKANNVHNNNANVVKKGNQNQIEGAVGNDISAMMNLAGFHGNGAGILGSGFQLQPNAFNVGNNAAAAALMAANANGYGTMMNVYAMQQQQQPQMMYNRTPLVPPTTGYYYGGGGGSGARVFDDDNASGGCSIM